MKAESKKLHRVTMNLTKADVANAEYVMEKTRSRNLAQAVSKALNLVATMICADEDGREIFIEDPKDGNRERLLIAR